MTVPAAAMPYTNIMQPKSRLFSQLTLRQFAAQQLQLRSADRPPTTPGGMRQSQSQSPRQALRLHQQQHFQQQQRLELEAAQQRPWRANSNSSAPMLDCPDVLPPDSSEPEWHGQMLTTLGARCPERASWLLRWPGGRLRKVPCALCHFLDLVP